MGRLARILAALTAATLGAACGPPIQAGAIVVLPGSTERLIVAMQLGYHGVGEAKPPASVQKITSKDELVGGPGAEGRVGDYVLENGEVVAVVAAIDGTERGGALVDVAREPRRIDEMQALRTSVLGAPVRYTTLKTGTDAATGAAFVEVSGLAGAVPISTRYDLAPELDAVVVHTSFQRAESRDAPQPDTGFDVGDELTLSVASRAPGDGPRGALAAFGAAAAYAVVPIGQDDGAAIRVVGPAIGLAGGRAPAGLVVYSRMVAPLERADTLSLSSALAIAGGQELGDVELQVVPERWTKGATVPPGRLRFQPPGGAPAVELDVPRSLHAGDTVSAKAPAGAWDVTFVSDELRSKTATRVVVRGRQLTTGDVVASPREAPPPVETASAPEP